MRSRWSTTSSRAPLAPLIVSSQLIRLDVPLMIAAAVAMWLMSLNGVISRVEGGVQHERAAGEQIRADNVSRKIRREDIDHNQDVIGIAGPFKNCPGETRLVQRTAGSCCRCTRPTTAPWRWS